MHMPDSRCDETPSCVFQVSTEGFKVQVIAEGKEVWILKFKEVADRTLVSKALSNVP
jgi:hypothetical protein